MQKIERKHVPWRARLQRLPHKTLSFSRSCLTHDLAIGLYERRGLRLYRIQGTATKLKYYPSHESVFKSLQLSIPLQQIAIDQVADQGIPRRTIECVQIPAAFAI
jgi:IS1 transposase